MQVYFVSLGCDKNLVDSEIMLGILNEEGHKITFDEQDADVIVVNTCSFIADATDEGVQTILRLAEYKKEKCRALIVTGCMVQRYREQIFEEMPEVDAIVGTGDFEEIGRIISGAETGGKQVLITDGRKIQEKSHLKRIQATPQHFAYLKIAEGCDNFCTYCTIPSIRGKYRSRSLESLIEEAGLLAQNGVRELVLVAQDTAPYGKDIYGESRLHELLRQLSQIDGIHWLRIMYCYPENLTDETVEEMRINPKVCHYLDMPVQHGSSAVLKRMGRRSSHGEITETVNKLRSAIPDIALRTSLIVGFPGETDEEFDELVDFVKEIRFDRLGVFTYSKEDGTAAAKMKNQLKKAVKKQRREKIMAIQQDISAEKCKSFIGRTIDVIVDGRIPQDEVYCGRGYMDCYDVDGMVFFESENEHMTGDLVRIKITGSSEYDLTGVVI